ncbi:hypothetical protein N9954_05065 [Maribacter sp.]|nr:hypothetical protein [Maribacter sp.]
MATIQSVNQWSAEVDILLVGCGLSGTVSAIPAHDLDPKAQILILEKIPKGLEDETK